MSWRVQVGRIRRRMWLVVLIIFIALIGGAASVLMTPTVYSSKAALGATSLTRSPEQDAILAQGYVNFFNDPSYQATLRQRAQVPADVTFEAQTAASSPLIYVVASSTSEADVRTAASKMATALLDTVNDSLRVSRDNTIAQVRKPYEEARGPNGEITDAARAQMEYQISLLNANTTNQLAELELNSGVSSVSPNIVQLMGLALFAGVVMGIALALAVGALSRKVDSAVDLAERTELPVLAVIPRHGSDHHRAERYGQLANVLSRSVPSPAVLVVTSPTQSSGIASVARAIAAHRADQGLRVVLLDADLRSAGSGDGLAEYLQASGPVDIDDLVQPSVAHAGVLEMSSGTDVASIHALDADRLATLLDALREKADLVVVMTSPVVETAGALVVCAAADATLVVVERLVTRTADVEESKRLIGRVDGCIAGAVLVEKNAVRTSKHGGTSAPLAAATSVGIAGTTGIPAASGSKGRTGTRHGRAARSDRGHADASRTRPHRRAQEATETGSVARSRVLEGRNAS